MKTTRKPDPEAVLIQSVLAVIVSLACLVPVLMTDLISLATDPNDLPSAMCQAPPRWAVPVIFARELVFAVAAIISVIILARLANHGRLGRSIMVWGIPIILSAAVVILLTMNLSTPLVDTPSCMGPESHYVYGYPYPWVERPGDWTSWTLPDGSVLRPFSTYGLIMNVILLINLCICTIGGIALIRMNGIRTAS